MVQDVSKMAHFVAFCQMYVFAYFCTIKFFYEWRMMNCGLNTVPLWANK